MSLHQSSPGFPKAGGLQAATAGTTQTQAGATQITAPNVVVTNGNANDGVRLPDSRYPNTVGQEVIVQNSHAANALNVYPYYDTTAAAGDGATIDGAGANAAKSVAAASTLKFVQTAVKTWKSIKLS